MAPLTLSVLLVMGLVLATLGADAANGHPVVLPLWPGRPPGDSEKPVGEYGPIGEEHIRPPSDAPTTTAKWLTSVTEPTISVYRAPKETDTRVAILLCPGGGYWNLAWDLEGTEVAERLNRAGITGIVLKYRVPRRAGQPEALPAPLPLLDAQRALSLVRSGAGELGIDPNRIGIAGFSAGGHLALAVATSFDKRAYDPIDSIDAVSCRPDFVAAIYPGYLLDEHTGGLTPRVSPPVCSSSR